MLHSQYKLQPNQEWLRKNTETWKISHFLVRLKADMVEQYNLSLR